MSILELEAEAVKCLVIIFSGGAVNWLIRKSPRPSPFTFYFLKQSNQNMRVECFGSVATTINWLL